MPRSAESGDGFSGVADGICHVGLTVVDLERSIGFYRDLLGLVLVEQWTEADDTVRRLVGYPEAELRTAILRFRESGVCIELNEYVCPVGKALDASTCNPGSGHLALYVDDLDAVLTVLGDAGVSIVGDVVSIDAGPLLGGRTVYVADPDGRRVELIQATALLDGTPRVASV